MQYGAGIDITPDGASGHLGGWVLLLHDHHLHRHTTIVASCDSDNALNTMGPGALQSIWYD